MTRLGTVDFETQAALRMAREDYERAHRWWPTSALRFVKRPIAGTENVNGEPFAQKILQQLWQSGAGKTEWRDVPVESEASG